MLILSCYQFSRFDLVLENSDQLAPTVNKVQQRTELCKLPFQKENYIRDKVGIVMSSICCPPVHWRE